MKPDTIVLKNIGPFRGAHSVDFTGLGDIFLVYGKTGAGKTTIFDAISYALYGEATGERKGIALSMRSHFASDGDESAVAFSFALGKKRYRVTRALPFEKVGVRSGKVTTVAEEVTLEEFAEGAWKDCSSTNKSDTDKRIVALIGLSSEEFSRIVLLPQGEFARFLRLNSNERKAVLAKLFPVEQYARVTELARIRARETGAKLKESENALLSLQEHFNRLTYDAERAALSDSIEGLKEKRDALRESLRERSATLEKARAAAEKKRKESALKERLAELERENETIDELRRRSQAALRAAPLASRLDGIEETKKRISDGSAELVRLEKESASREARLYDLESRTDWIAGLAGEKARLLLRKEQLRVASEIAEKLEDELAEYDGTKKRLAAADRRKSAIAEEAAKFAARRALLDEDRSALESRNEDSAHRREALERAKVIKSLCDEYATEKKALDAHAGAVLHLAEQAESSRSDSAIARAELSALEAEAQAAGAGEAAVILASSLQDGKPCPVCGSLTHPAPALHSPTDRFSVRERIEAGKRRVDQIANQEAALEKNRAGREADLRNAQDRVSSITAKYRALDAARPSSEAMPTPDGASSLVREAAARMQDITDALNRSRAAWRDTEEIRKQEAAIAAEGERLASEILELEKTAAAQKSDVAQKKARYKEAFPDGNEIADPADALGECEARILSIDAETKAHEAGLKETRELLASISGRQEEIAHSLGELASALSASEAAFSKDLAAAGFPGNDAVRAANIPEADRAETARRIENFDRSLTETKSLLADLALDLSKWDGPDAGSAGAGIEETNRMIGESDRELEGKSGALSALDSLKARFDALESERAERSIEAGKMGALSGDLTGNNRIKTGFDAWILGMYLEEITAYANERLERMSEGRYRIQINDSYRKGNGYAGLELEILDAYTGKARPSATLSGGETFMTSISLALGLADSIQSRSGGIQLDAVFIDEGFGSLDESSLERAITILDEIRGSRMVGLISHVAELKARIPNRIEVVKTVEGSSIRKELHTQGEI